MKDLISIPFSWDDLCDIIHYVDWKVQEVDEAGCELEHPNIRNVLKRLEYIKSRMTYNSTEEAQKIIDKWDDWDTAAVWMLEDNNQEHRE
tara:strand:+ start:253 stop:522 length:270 start_codon:yes stop_codon:yes gene_type:complete